jgi:hypothetical protein
MPPSTPPLDFDHLPGREIPTKHKEAIRQLYGFGKILIEKLIVRYKLGKSTINRVLSYDKLEHSRDGRSGRPIILSDSRVDEIIEYLSESWDHRILKYSEIVEELKLPCSAAGLELRLKQRGSHRCVACQKPYLTLAQVTARLLWAITYIFWTHEWLKVLWSDEVTFLVGGRAAKARVTRKRGERTHPTCVQH